MVAVLGAFGAGAISFFSPCILPVLPGLFAYLLKDADNMGQGWSIRQDMMRILPFAAGFSVIFVLLGLAAGGVGQSLLEYQRHIEIIGGTLVTVFGLHLLGAIQIPIFSRGGLSPRGNQSGLLMGAVFSVTWTPCVSPILASLLLVVAVEGSIAFGATLLSSYALGLMLPLVLSAVLWRRALKMSRAVQRWGFALHRIAGAILTALGLAIMTGYFERITSLFV